MTVHFSSKTDLHETPQDFFDRLDAIHHFDLDVCATDANAKCVNYFTEQENGLTQKWFGICWMNPPYGREIGNAIHHKVEFIRGRLKFGKAKNSVPFPSALVFIRAREN